ncbi:hypothetical protein [Odoribacter laneus]|uniref:hypothetical protein n=1 Tax=Odoribacter laneus TaxID=626933 RepID=UPI00248FC1BA|nr:hypothetical protein [Odoribacter laneus]
MKLLILLMVLSFVTGCKNSKITSNKEERIEKDSLLNIKEQITEDTSMNRTVIHKMIEQDELLNKYRRIPEDSLLLTKIHYKDTIPNYIIGLNEQTPKDSILYFMNYKPNDSTWRIVVYKGFQRNQELEKFIIEYISQNFLSHRGAFSKYFKYRFLEYFKYDKYYYVKYYSVSKSNITSLDKIYIIQNNKILYFNLMPYFSIEKNFETTQEHLESEREVMIDDVPNYIIMGNTEEDDVIE